MHHELLLPQNPYVFNPLKLKFVIAINPLVPRIHLNVLSIDHTKIHFPRIKRICLLAKSRIISINPYYRRSSTFHILSTNCANLDEIIARLGFHRF